MTELSIGIVGAGVGGLAAATALAQAGHQVRVFEQAPSLEPVGAGLQISPNGMNVLRTLGFAESVLQSGVRAEAVRLLHGHSGKLVAELNLRRDVPDLDWVFVHRAEIIGILHNAAMDAGVSITFGQMVTIPENGKALDEDDLLIGADGLHSKTRHQIVGSHAPNFTGQVAWRALIADEAMAPVVEVYMGPGRHLVSYPISENRRNIVAVEERTEWAEEGWNHPDDPQALCQAFRHFNSRATDWLGRVEQTYLWGLFTHPVPQTWSKGHQVLLGDAVHPMLPFLAQGAVMALEDAWVLRRSLDDPDMARALRSYGDRRSARVRRVMVASSANARNYHLAGPARVAAHSALRMVNRFAPSKLTSRFDWLYRHDVTER